MNPDLVLLRLIEEMGRRGGQHSFCPQISAMALANKMENDTWAENRGVAGYFDHLYAQELGIRYP